MLIMLIMLIKKVAQNCRLGNKAEFAHPPIGNMNQSKNLTLLTISMFYGRQLEYCGIDTVTHGVSHWSSDPSECLVLKHGS